MGEMEVKKADGPDEIEGAEVGVFAQGILFAEVLQGRHLFGIHLIVD